MDLYSTKLLWNMCLADFLKIYTLGSLFIIMNFFFAFFWLKGCYKKYPPDLRAIGRLLSMSFFQSSIKKQFIWNWPWSLRSIYWNLESFCCQGLASKLHQTIVIGSFTDMLKEFISGRRQSVLCSNVPVVRVLDSQSKGLQFETTWCLQGRLSLLCFWGQSNEYQQLPGT